MGPWGNFKSPLGLMTVLCLVPCDLGHSGLGGRSHHACCQVAGLCLVPCNLWLLGLGRALLLGAFLSTGLCCLLFVLVCSCSFAFALVACSVSRCFAVAFLGLGLSCLGRVGLRFWVSGLFVRSFSFRPAACAVQKKSAPGARPKQPNV